MPPKTLLRLGLAFLLVASSIYFLTGRWLHSRIFTPLDYSVSLDHRQLQSPPFKINLRETYFTSLDLDYSADDWYQDNRCNYRTILYPQWRVYRLSSDTARPRKLWVSSDQLTHSDGSLSNAFVASPGQYQLEWDIPAAAPCLNPRHPQLLVFTDSSGYQEGVGLTQLTGEFRARAIVRDSRPGKGMGVQFVQMQPSDRARLNQFLSQYASADGENPNKSSD